jgi:ectoine hydroxylase
VLFECNVMHASTENLSPYPRSNAFFVYNSLENRLVEPFAAPAPRPEYIATRDFTPLDMLG